MKRTELHLHTKFSDSIALIDVCEIIDRAEELGLSAVAFTSLGSVQDFHSIEKTASKKNFKAIYGAEVKYRTEEGDFSATLLVKNNEGLKEFYRVLSSLDEEKYIDVCVLKENRKNLLVGSAGYNGELFDKISKKINERKLENLCAFYDYFELYPARFDEDEEVNHQIYALSEDIGVLCVAVSNAHYLTENDAVCRDILLEARKIQQDNLNLSLRSYDELLSEFSYLGNDSARAVISNADIIASMVESVKIAQDDFFDVKLGDDYKIIENICLNRVIDIYGYPLPKEVEKRLVTELSFISKNDFASFYHIAYKMTKFVKDEGHIYTIRGTAGSVFVSFLLGISDVNPLPPHYYCPNCYYFEETKMAACETDLPDKKCPKCDRPLKTDGNNIPYESFMGFSGDKLPDFDINVPAGVRDKLIGYMKGIFGEEKLARAGVVSTLFDHGIDKILKEYEKTTNISFTSEQKEQIRLRLNGVKSGEGVHPGSIMVIPKDKAFEDFTPLRKNNGILPETHFCYHNLHDNILKLDVLENSPTELLERLKEKTGFDPFSIDAKGEELLEFLEASDTLGFPEFDYDFVKTVIEKTKPRNIADLIKIICFTHGTGVWVENGEYLIEKDIPLSQIPASREDIMNDLISVGVSKGDAYKVSEIVRKGLFTRDKVNLEEQNRIKELCRPLGYWYFDYISKIRYMFPKAHALQYVLSAARCAWFKKHYTKEFYNSYLECFFADRKNLTLKEEQELAQINQALNNL